MLSPSPGATLTDPIVTFRWSEPKTHSSLEYWLDVGTRENVGDIYGGTVTAPRKTIANLPVDGRPVYVRLWTFINGSKQAPLDYRYTACSDPNPPDPRAHIISPEPGTTLTPSVTFTWTRSPRATQYWLDVGNQLGQGDIYGGWQGVNTSRTVGNLPTDGRTIHVRLWTLIDDAKLQPLDYSYRAQAFP
jgi:hypothetical protein